MGIVNLADEYGKKISLFFDDEESKYENPEKLKNFNEDVMKYINQLLTEGVSIGRWMVKRPKPDVEVKINNISMREYTSDIDKKKNDENNNVIKVTSVNSGNQENVL